VESETPEQTDPKPESFSEQLSSLRPDTRAGWIELVASILLAMATVATAWSGYQSARWGGVQATDYAEASTKRIESTRASTRGGQQVQIDIGLFTNWINAYAEDNEPLVNFYQERFRAEFVPAFDAWLATDPANNPDAPSSPFVMPEYRVADLELADQLEAEATLKFKDAGDANQQSDDYVLNTVILASVLFFAGLANRFNSTPAKLVILLAAILMFSMGLFNLGTYPIE
jgi:hypothetical protein